MAAEDERKQQRDGQGFAGISAMVSNVDATLASISQQAKRRPSRSSSQQSAQESLAALQEPNLPTQNTDQPPVEPSSGTSTIKWLFVIAVVIGAIWLVSQPDSKKSSVATYSSGASSTPVVPVRALPVAPPQVPSRPAEEKPSVGRNNVLTNTQIRYCLAEKIRLDAAEIVIDKHINSDVDRFNGFVADYNSRCGEFRYQQGALESARKDVEPYRAQLQAEGRSSVVRSAIGTKTPRSELSPQPALVAPDLALQTTQRRLNELGYDAGTADGVFGDKTRAAIQAFQRDNGITVDGAANAALLRQLEVPGREGRRENNAPVLTPGPILSPARPSTAPQSISGISQVEKASIERACDNTRRYSGPSAYQSCLSRELASLQSSGGRPDLSLATSSERIAIERACESARQYSGPGAYYNCLSREMSNLRSTGGKPDLSSASRQEQTAIERACDSARQYSGPSAYYNCLSRELSNLRLTGGRPDLSSASRQEQAAIERACDSARQYSGPGTYYSCLRRELNEAGYR